MTITWGSSWAVAALPGSPGESASAASAACDTAPARTIEAISASSALRICGYLADCGCKPGEHSVQRAPGCSDARIEPRRCSAWVTQRGRSVAFLAAVFPATQERVDNPLFDNTGRCCSA